VREVSLRKPRKPPSAPKPAAKEPARSAAKAGPTSKAPATKRAAAAISETAAHSVVTVPSPEPDAAPAQPADRAEVDTDAAPPRPEGSMPPTDLDVVDVVVDLRSLDDAAPSGDTPEPPGLSGDTPDPPGSRERAPIGPPPPPPGGPPAP
jgi:hypothetical protein